MLDEQDHLLIVLAEECAELSKNIMKAIRFGVDDTHPLEHVSNRQLINSEMNDVIAVIKQLRGFGFKEDLKAQDMKVAKLRGWMKYSMANGKLVSDVVTPP